MSQNRDGTASLSQSMQEATLAHIQKIFSTETASLQVVATDDEEEDAAAVVDVEDQRRKTQALTGMLPTLEHLWGSHSPYMARVTEAIANGSRDSKFLLSPYGTRRVPHISLLQIFIFGIVPQI